MSQSTTEVREAITAAIEKFMVAYNQGDAAGLVALYTKKDNSCQLTAILSLANLQSRDSGKLA